STTGDAFSRGAFTGFGASGGAFADGPGGAGAAAGTVASGIAAVPTGVAGSPGGPGVSAVGAALPSPLGGAGTAADAPPHVERRNSAVMRARVTARRRGATSARDTGRVECGVPPPLLAGRYVICSTAVQLVTIS